MVLIRKTAKRVRLPPGVPASGVSRRKRTSRRSRWLLKPGLALLPLMALAVLEIGLRLGGAGYATGFFTRRQHQGQSFFADNPAFGRRFFPPALVRTAQPLWVNARKPAGTVRIVVLGESAAMGDPEPAFGLARNLEVLLQAADTGHKIEVINAAMTAINSHAIVAIARDCVPLQADFWVLYMGNNEVVGPYGPGTVFGPRAPHRTLIRAALRLKTLRIGQMADRVVQWLRRKESDPTAWQGMEMFLNRTVAADAPSMAVVYRNFQQNLGEIMALARQAGVNLVVCTVGANLKDCAPFTSLHRPQLSSVELQTWQDLVRTGSELAAAGKPGEALAKYRQAEELDGRYAELQHRMGRCLWEMGRHAEARKVYQLALDLDALRFRVDSELNRIIRETSRGRAGEGIVLVDGEAAIAQASPFGAAGCELFWEHVHLNFEGNYRLGRAVAEQLAPLWPGGAGLRTNWITLAEAGRRLADSDWAQAQVGDSVFKRIERAPFTNQWNHAAQRQSLRQNIDRWRSQCRGPALAAQVELHRRAAEAYPEDWVLAEKLARVLRENGNLAGALKQWRRVEVLMPRYAQAVYQQGNLQYEQGRIRDAMALFERVLALKADTAEAWNGLALCHLKEGRPAEAMQHCRRALRIKADDPDFHFNLGNIQLAQGLTNEAVRSYRQAIAADPDHAKSYNNLGNLLMQLGQGQEAGVIFQRLVERVPEDVSGRNSYGAFLARQSRVAEAIVHFREAVRLEPGNLEARFNLANALVQQRDLDAAIALMETLVRERPDWALPRQRLEQIRQMKQAETP